MERNAERLELLFNRKVRHECTDDTFQFAAVQTILTNEIKQLIAVVDLMAVSHDQTVGISVQRNTDIAAGLLNAIRKRFRMGCADTFINIESVRCITSANDGRTEFMIDIRRNVVGSAVGAVHINLEALQIQI